jgi:hypothetical protein
MGSKGVSADALWGVDPDAIEPIVASNQVEVLARQLQGALGDVRTCAITLDEDADLEGAFVVTLDGERVPRSECAMEDGRLVLSGEPCARVLDDAETLEVDAPCLSMP